MRPRGPGLLFAEKKAVSKPIVWATSCVGPVRLLNSCLKVLKQLQVKPIFFSMCGSKFFANFPCSLKMVLGKTLEFGFLKMNFALKYSEVEVWFRVGSLDDLSLI